MITDCGSESFISTEVSALHAWTGKPDVAGNPIWRIVKTRVNPSGIMGKETKLIWPEINNPKDKEKSA
jgi:hypothetical protein